MKICYIYLGGFIEGSIRPGFWRHYWKYPRRVSQILTRIKQRGHQIIAINIEPSFSNTAIPYINYGFSAYSALLKSLRSRVDLFLADYPEAGFLATICKKIKNRPFVFDCRDNYSELVKYGPTSQFFKRDRYLKHLEKTIYKFADQVITASEDLRQRCLSFGTNKNNVVHIPHGSNIKMFNPLIKGENIKKEMNLNSPSFIYVGKIEPYYHLDILINAFSLVLNEEPLSKFIIVGDGRGLRDLKSLPKLLGISDSVIFTGFQPYEMIPEYIGAADISIFPHSSGLAIYEYMASGKPIIKLKAEKGDLLEHLENGFLIERRTPEEFAKGMIQVLRDKELANKLGKNARKLAVEKYDWKIIVNNYIEILHKVIRKKT